MSAEQGEEENKALMEPSTDGAALGAGVSLPERSGALTLIFFTNIKGISRAEMMPCQPLLLCDSSICSSATGAEPQGSSATACCTARG